MPTSYELVCKRADTVPNYRVCELDQQSCVITKPRSFLRAIVRHERHETSIVFQFPIGLVTFFPAFIFFELTLSSAFPVETVEQWLFISFHIFFMTGGALLIWRICHVSACKEARVLLEAIQNETILDGSLTTQGDGEPYNSPEEGLRCSTNVQPTIRPR